MKQDEKILDGLYQQGQKEAPPAELDQLIMAQAKASNKSQQANWRPWLAAASVVLALPLIWFLTQSPELTQIATPTGHPPKPQATLKTEPINQAPATEDQGMAADMEPASEAPFLSAPAPVSSMTEIQQVIEEQESLAITGQPLSKQSLERNRKQLIDELKGKKRSINAGTMSPLMALEYEQFNRYLERGQFDAADQLLSEMQESFPDYDYEDMTYQLAEAELNAGNQ